jgi:hypothetical protein
MRAAVRRAGRDASVDVAKSVRRSVLARRSPEAVSRAAAPTIFGKTENEFSASTPLARRRALVVWRCRLTGALVGRQNRPVAEGGGGARAPDRTREQRLRALEQANAVRTARAKLKRQLASGEIGLMQILADPPACVRTARLREVLLAVPKIGSVRAGRILAHCRIADAKTLAGLTDRQRGELIKLFRC